MQIPEAIRSELDAGEQVLWAGQPRQGVVLRSSDLFAIPFSVVWGGFAVFWLTSAIHTGAPLEFMLFGIPFVMVGLYIVVGRFFVEARRRANMSYAVTSQRVLIVSGLLGKKVKSLNLKTIPELSLSLRPDGSGTITFGAPHALAAMFGGMSSWPGAAQHQAPCFDLVPEARAVYDTLRKAQAAA